MKKYKIIYNDNRNSYNIDDIKSLDSRNIVHYLSPGCEVFDVTDEEIHLCSLSHKASVCLGIEIADHFYKNHNNLYNVMAKKFIELVRKWVNDTSSVSDEEIHDCIALGYSDCKQDFIALGYGSSKVALHSLLFVINYSSMYALCTAAYTDSVFIFNEDPEKIRQEHHDIFLNFIKSGKHLFLV